MTAKEFFEQQSTTDANNKIVDKNAHKYNRFDLVKFAQAYHESEVKKLGLFNVTNRWYRCNPCNLLYEEIETDYIKRCVDPVCEKCGRDLLLII